MLEIIKKNNLRKNLSTKKKGFALPSAIFLLVMLSILGVGLLTFNSYSQKTMINDVLEAKANSVAKAGLDYGAYLASNSGICPTTAQTITLNESYLVGFKFTYSCSQNIANEAGIDQTYYVITSYGCNTTNANCPDNSGRPNQEDYVEKSLTLITSKK